jgi:hypothetical protein
MTAAISSFHIRSAVRSTSAGSTAEGASTTRSIISLKRSRALGPKPVCARYHPAALLPVCFDLSLELRNPIRGRT